MIVPMIVPIVVSLGSRQQVEAHLDVHINYDPGRASLSPYEPDDEPEVEVLRAFVTEAKWSDGRPIPDELLAQGWGNVITRGLADLVRDYYMDDVCYYAQES